MNLATASRLTKGCKLHHSSGITARVVGPIRTLEETKYGTYRHQWNLPVVSDVSARADGIMFVTEYNCEEWEWRGCKRKRPLSSRDKPRAVPTSKPSARRQRQRVS